MSHRHQSVPSCIEPDVLYHLSEFMARTGFGKHAMRTARNKGLKVRDIGGRRFVYANDFFDWLKSREEAPSAVA